jgi:gamma-glutamylputrescine oxidase
MVLLPGLQTASRSREHRHQAITYPAEAWAPKKIGLERLVQSQTDDDEVRFAPPSCANQSLSCQLLVVGGGLSGLSAAEPALQRGIDVVLIEKGAFGQEAASALNAGQFLSGWAKPVEVMVDELTTQEQAKGARANTARSRAKARVRAFLRRTVEGCQRLADLDHTYNLRSSVRHGAVTAAATEGDLKSLQRSYDFMEKSNFRALMPLVGDQRRPFFKLLSARQLESRCGTAKDVYAGGVVDRFGGSFRPRKLLGGLGQALQKRGVRIFQETEAEAVDTGDELITVFCSNGAAIKTKQIFMANAYARHINAEVLERSIFAYDYVVMVDLPDGAKTLAQSSVLSDTRDPCFYARRHGTRLYMGYEETAETSEKITRHVARRTLKEAQRIFPELRALNESDIKAAWSGRVYYTLDDYPFVERALDGRLTTFAAPSDHGNALAAKVGQLVGDLAADAEVGQSTEQDAKQRRDRMRQLKLFEDFPKGQRLRPGRRYQEAAS